MDVGGNQFLFDTETKDWPKKGKFKKYHARECNFEKKDHMYVLERFKIVARGNFNKNMLNLEP